MQFLILSLIVASVALEYLKKIGWLPTTAPYVQELLSAWALIYVVAVGVRDRFRFVRPAYWITFGAIALVMLCGVLLNAVAPGPVFAGMRTYLRAIPLFLLPAVYAFAEPQVRVQLKMLFALCLLQIPISVVQWQQTAARGGFTGDYTSGTLMVSSILSIFLICAACILTGLYLRKRLRLWLYLLMLLLVLVPTSINETKGTLLLLPIGLLVTFIAGSARGTRLRNALAASILISAFATAFVVVYDYTQKGKPYKSGIIEFFTEGKVSNYMYRGAGFGLEYEQVGRLDAIAVPLEYLARDPVHLAFGLGIGNASSSSLGPEFGGKYAQLFRVFLQSAAVRLLLETGLLGLLLVMVLMYLVFRDSRYVAESDSGLMGALSLGWSGVMVVITIALFYKDLIPTSAVSFLFWYYSGLMAAHRMRLVMGS